ncbi:amidophosphoribosyltransferase [Heyndrickxia sporothermodurans]|uniref:ComF family protein n=1 Tax=Heyndrickxia sporothermodurans TaxID=46224 RepID=UPI000D3B38E2|nr:ComF family protein [Heyndrickxia sporothermodurans]PTY80447.1 amidophosphoribosyltransferase [Heyndrickxia sporothermodurans]
MSDHCLNCHLPLPFELTWRSLFKQLPPSYLCKDCKKQLAPIHPPICPKCSRPLEKLSKDYLKGDVCLDCYRWENDTNWTNILDKNISFYEYNDFLKDLLARFKYRGDYILAKIFSQKIQKELEKISCDEIVPIPLSNERLLERGFNQSTALATEANLNVANLLTRVHTEKQSKKSRQERIHLQQVFNRKDDVKLEGENILLIDDIYTTGSTLRHAAKILKEAGAKSVTSITIARG